MSEELERGDERDEEYEQKKALCRPIQMCSASEKAEAMGWNLLCDVMGKIPLTEYAEAFEAMEKAYKDINNTTALPSTYRSAKSILWRGVQTDGVFIWDVGHLDSPRGKSDVEKQLKEANKTEELNFDLETTWKDLVKAKNRYTRNCVTIDTTRLLRVIDDTCCSG